MEIGSEELTPFLSGDQFSNGLVVHIPKTKVVGRLEELTRLATNATVIHFGYCDHLPLVEKKIVNGNWLHGIFNNVATRCAGLDIDASAVEEIRERFGVQNGHAFNLFQDSLPSEVTDHHWDYLVMGEILEHVDNPVEFLAKMKRVFAPYVSSLVVTVPNAYDITSQRFWRQNTEFINSDHRYWFTPYTLAKVAFQAELKLLELRMCDESMAHSWWRRVALNRRPILAETIVAAFDLQSAQS